MKNIWIVLCLIFTGCQTIDHMEYQSYPTFTFTSSSDVDVAIKIIDEYFKAQNFEKLWFEGYIYKEKYIAYKIKVISLKYYCPNQITECEAIRLIPLYSFTKQPSYNSNNSAYEWNNKISRELLSMLNKPPHILEAKNFTYNYNGGNFKPRPKYVWCESRPKTLCIVK